MKHCPFHDNDNDNDDNNDDDDDDFASYLLIQK